MVLACDYDGTLAKHGLVDEPTLQSLERCLDSGRKLVLVTGRQLPELMEIFPGLYLFEWVVAENGGLLYRPATRQEKPLADPPSEEFVALLRERGVSPCSTGRVVVAAWEPHQTTILQTIHDLGLELQVIFNKGAVMVLPSGINKATGLSCAARTGFVGSQHGGHWRRGKRSCAAGRLRGRRRGGQCATHAQGTCRLGDARRSRRRRAATYRSAGGGRSGGARCETVATRYFAGARLSPKSLPTASVSRQSVDRRQFQRRKIHSGHRHHRAIGRSHISGMCRRSGRGLRRAGQRAGRRHRATSSHLGRNSKTAGIPRPKRQRQSAGFGVSRSSQLFSFAGHPAARLAHPHWPSTLDRG